jgi:hypothetical protein
MPISVEIRPRDLVFMNLYAMPRLALTWIMFAFLMILGFELVVMFNGNFSLPTLLLGAITGVLFGVVGVAASVGLGLLHQRLFTSRNTGMLGPRT